MQSFAWQDKFRIETHQNVIFCPKLRLVHSPSQQLQTQKQNLSIDRYKLEWQIALVNRTGVYSRKLFSFLVDSHWLLQVKKKNHTVLVIESFENEMAWNVFALLCDPRGGERKRCVNIKLHIPVYHITHHIFKHFEPIYEVGMKKYEWQDVWTETLICTSEAEENRLKK